MYRFVVCGRGEFPFSLLKETSCYPASTEDYRSISFTILWLTPSSYRRLRYITLDSTNRPDENRWQAFGWKIIQ